MNLRRIALTVFLTVYIGLAATIGAIETGVFATRSFGIMTVSSYAQRLAECTDMLAIAHAKMQTSQQRLLVASDCKSLALDALETMPSNGLAHFVLAVSFHHFDKNDSRDTHLKLSQKFAPFEGWIAERRFVFTVQIGQENSNDIEVLLNTQSGAELLARQYEHDPKLRPIILSLAQSSLVENQNRLLNILRASRGAG